MKIMKKIAAVTIAAAALFAFAGCSDDDDPNEMITKVTSKEYTIEYSNESSEISRGYKSTALKHSGGFFVIEIENQKSDQSAADGVMGVIFDLHENSEKKDFYVIGVNYGYNKSKKFGYYASKFRNVTDLQAANFGAGNGHVYATTALENFNSDTAPAELVLKEAFTYNANITPDENGKIKVAIDVSMNEGAYIVKMYKASDLNEKEDGVKESATAIINETIPATTTGYTKEEQGKIGFYANVYANKTLKGTWKLPDAQNYIQVVEE